MTDASVRNRLSTTLGWAMERVQRLVVNLGQLVVALGWSAFWLMVARLHLMMGDWVGLIGTVAVAAIPILLLSRSYLPSGVIKAPEIHPARSSGGGQGSASNE